MRRYRYCGLPVLVLAGLFAGPRAGSQQQAPATPERSLSDALSAACRQDANAFSNSFTTDNAKAYRALPPPQRIAIMKRFVLLDEPGRTLLSTSSSGGEIVRCESPGIATEMRLGETRLRENLAFIPLEIPLEGEAPRSVTFGLVREAGSWKLLSVGLVLLDIPAMAKQWEQADLDAQEDNAIANLREIARALDTYQRAYGTLPDGLAELGPGPPNGVSPEAAGLLDAELAAGSKGGYSIRYNVIPMVSGSMDESSEKKETFAITASPREYGKTGKRSFFLDSTGILRGDDKQGGIATYTDPAIRPST
jgi:hypothetical protein